MTDDSHRPAAGRRGPLALFIAGAVAGMVAAAVGLLGDPSDSGALPAEAAARVNGQIIQRLDHDRLIQALQADRRSVVPAEAHAFALDRLIDEELLVQRGLELGLAQHDTRVRKDLTLAMIESVVADYRDLDATDQELRAYFEAERDFFAQAGRFRLRQIWVRARTLADGEAAFERAREASERLRAGAAFDRVRSELGDAESPPLPDALLPPNKLADYLGPTVLRAALELELGAISEPVRSSTGYHVLQLVELGPADAPQFEAIRPQVLAEYRRRQADQALRGYLADLRDRADVEIAADLRPESAP